MPSHKRPVGFQTKIRFQWALRSSLFQLSKDNLLSSSKKQSSFLTISSCVVPLAAASYKHLKTQLLNLSFPSGAGEQLHKAPRCLHSSIVLDTVHRAELTLAPMDTPSPGFPTHTELSPNRNPCQDSRRNSPAVLRRTLDWDHTGNRPEAHLLSCLEASPGTGEAGSRRHSSAQLVWTLEHSVPALFTHGFAQ